MQRALTSRSNEDSRLLFIFFTPPPLGDMSVRIKSIA